MGRGPLAKGRPGSGGAAATRLRAAVLAPGRRDDGTRGLGRWLWAPLGLGGVRFGLRRGRNGRNRGEKSRFLARVPEISDLKIPQNESKFSIFFLLGFVRGDPNCFSVQLIAISSPFPLRFRPILKKIVETAILGVLGRRGSRAAGERCPALPGLPEPFCFLNWGRRVTGSRSTLLGPA
ncbi:hypothetical protein CRG98_038978 [Punica granatum]|uniref:Uncharacterized protein n=1 Tax=Punica granatum TaxID=22663 RepID=A0A2I0I9F1_PUNGR|nr:hypothetical protein CRG98_038978 [Punica granatum]